ncbi:MAG TPA: GspH/FimT family pseudopilin [Rudaea sp.]|nr:GspH/FimT family pseudopilin [Rudaea sp.]
MICNYCGKNSRLVQQQGFTLIELMITIMIAAILVTLALPSFKEITLRNNVTSTTNRLIHDLNLARSEATSRGTLVAVVSKSGSNNWSSGWDVEPVKSDGTVPSPATLLHSDAGVDSGSGYKVTAKAFAGVATGSGPTASDSRVIFTAQGNLIPKAQSYQINVCRPDSKPKLSQWITVMASGIVRSQIDTSSSSAPGC